MLNWKLNLIIYLSDRERLEELKSVYDKEIKNLENDEIRIGRKTSALAILYQKRCLVDKSKSDAVKIYLKYQIELARTEGRDKNAKELEKELVEKLWDY